MPAAETALIVDPHGPARRGTARVLTTAGYSVVQRPDGSSALAGLALDRPAVVLIAAVLPDVSSDAVIREIRRDRAMEDVAVLLLVNAMTAPTKLVDAPRLDKALAYYPPEHREMLVREIDACVTTGAPFDFESPIVTAKGRHIWIRAIGEAVHDARGRIVKLQGAMLDITDQKETADRLAQAATRLSTTLEGITDAFVTIDRDWKIVYVNALAARLVQLSREELVGRWPSSITSRRSISGRRCAGTRPMTDLRSTSAISGSSGATNSS
jgi:PAS domain-containing protein